VVSIKCLASEESPCCPPRLDASESWGVRNNLDWLLLGAKLCSLDENDIDFSGNNGGSSLLRVDLDLLKDEFF